ncbi:MAG: ABC-type nitrate/sulfonate/bicarbonate transport system, permease component [Betaproteobacteria bacterium]|nr:ABC-type nitrate/sulfonate/bicarbonate transport system, permease component [Betaproteobacteria bacterium]
MTPLASASLRAEDPAAMPAEAAPLPAAQARPVIVPTGAAPFRSEAPAARTVSKPERTPILPERVRSVLLALAFPLALIVAWHELVVITGTRLVPTPYQVGLMMVDFTVGGIHDDAFSGTILTHLFASMQRVYGGFALAIVLGVPLGLLIGRVKVIRQLVDPTLSLLRPIPVTAWLPLSMIFFGLGPRSAIFLVFLGAFYPIVLNTVFGVRSVDPKLFEAASMLGCDGTRMFRQVVLPAASPSIFNGLRLAHGFAWFLIVVGEMTGVPTGLGSVIMDGRNLSRTDLIITGMIVIGLAGFATDRGIVALNNRVLRWSPQHHG